MGKIPNLTNMFQSGWNHQLDDGLVPDDFPLWGGTVFSGNLSKDQMLGSALRTLDSGAASKLM